MDPRKGMEGFQTDLKKTAAETPLFLFGRIQNLRRFNVVAVRPRNFEF